MQVRHRGNLTVELIRAERFGPDHPWRVADRLLATHRAGHACDSSALGPSAGDCWRRVDRVELSREALGCDPWALGADRCALLSSGCESAEPVPHACVEPRDMSQCHKPITPVVGSPVLSGLGVSLIVPGTLLDVVA